MEISRHFVRVQGRRVHYRRCGSGPALLLIHQSPRSSAEYEPLLREWGRQFTCVAPDTPGFGESDPLAHADADIDAFAQALIDFLDAVGLPLVGAYGFHSGGIILLAAMRLASERFTALAIGGYAVWTPEERTLFAGAYLPPFQPQPYGEHLVWLWNRVLEQSWFFPWFAAEPRFRLGVAHDDVTRVDATVRDMLAAGDAYRVGYGAVLAAPRDIPPPDSVTPPVLITAYPGDPLHIHLERLGSLPPSWRAHSVATPAEQQAANLALLSQHPAPPPGPAENAAEGFVRLSTSAFAGLIHWRQPRPEPGALQIHAPGEALDLMRAGAGTAIDLPGHGLSDDWPGEAPTTWQPWGEVLAAAAEALGCEASAPPTFAIADPERCFPDLAPDRFGTYLICAWQIVRARQLFEPWYEANAAHARAFDPADLAPERLAREHRALLNARSARAYAIALKHKELG